MKTSLQMKKHIEIDTFFSSKSNDFLFSLELLFFFFFTLYNSRFIYILYNRIFGQCLK